MDIFLCILLAIGIFFVGYCLFEAAKIAVLKLEPGDWPLSGCIGYVILAVIGIAGLLTVIIQAVSGMSWSHL